MAIFPVRIRRKVWTIFIAAMIFLPCVIEAQPIDNTKVSPEIRNSLAISRVGLKKCGADHQFRESLLLPEQREVIRKNLPKFGTSLQQSCMTFAPKGQPVRSEKAKQSNCDTNKCKKDSRIYLYFSLYLMMLSAVLTIWQSTRASWKKTTQPFSKSNGGNKHDQPTEQSLQATKRDRQYLLPSQE